MSDLQTLRDRVISLARGTDRMTAHGRDIGGGDACAAMQRAIEETQMPRHLVFRNDAGKTITLTVASGRVLALAEPLDDDIRSQCATLMPGPLSENDPGQAATLGAVIAAFLQKTRGLAVDSRFLADNCQGKGIGIAAQALFHPCAAPAPCPAAGQLSFLDSIASIATAYVHIEAGTLAAQSGTEERVKALIKLAEDEAPQPRNRNGDVPESCVLLTGHPENGDAILCASTPDSLVIAMFQATSLGRVFTLWQDRAAGS